jgi:hypothetical protein
MSIVNAKVFVRELGGEGGGVGGEVGLERIHSSPIPDIPLMCFALYILLKG